MKTEYLSADGRPWLWALIALEAVLLLSLGPLAWHDWFQAIGIAVASAIAAIFLFALSLLSWWRGRRNPHSRPASVRLLVMTGFLPILLFPAAFPLYSLTRYLRATSGQRAVMSAIAGERSGKATYRPASEEDGLELKCSLVYLDGSPTRVWRADRSDGRGEFHFMFLGGGTSFFDEGWVLMHDTSSTGGQGDFDAWSEAFALSPKEVRAFGHDWFLVHVRD
ncbi:MAG TPA: hypothetical protein VJ600_04650 [Holophagaceae bacterium]|nr:hypothetical protein [Holophagaceae bacterium]